MNFFQHPLEIWLASFVAVMIKLKTSTKLSWFNFIATASIAMFSGIVLYQPVAELFGLSPSWNPFLAMLIAISAENVLNQFSKMSNDEDFVRDWLKFIVTRKVEYREQKDTPVPLPPPASVPLLPPAADDNASTDDTNK